MGASNTTPTHHDKPLQYLVMIGQKFLTPSPTLPHSWKQNPRSKKYYWWTDVRDLKGVDLCWKWDLREDTIVDAVRGRKRSTFLAPQDLRWRRTGGLTVELHRGTHRPSVECRCDCDWWWHWEKSNIKTKWASFIILLSRLVDLLKLFFCRHFSNKCDDYQLWFAWGTSSIRVMTQVG